MTGKVISMVHLGSSSSTGVLLGGFALLCQMINKNNAMNTVVKVNQLSILDHNRSLLNDVNLTITKGHFIAL